MQLSFKINTILDVSSRSINSEVTNAQKYAQAIQKRMSRRRLDLSYIGEVIANWISSHQDGITINNLEII